MAIEESFSQKLPCHTSSLLKPAVSVVKLFSLSLIKDVSVRHWQNSSAKFSICECEYLKGVTSYVVSLTNTRLGCKGVQVTNERRVSQKEKFYNIDPIWPLDQVSLSLFPFLGPSA